MTQNDRGVQNPDGSWSIAPEYPGDVNMTVEGYFALKILGIATDLASICRARHFVVAAGGIAKVRIFTRIFPAQFGLFPWAALPQLPAELILLPPQCPVNIYKLASWARGFAIPLLIIRHHEPIYALPNHPPNKNSDFLDELWCNPSDKLIPYTPSLWSIWNTDLTSFAFAVADKGLWLIDGLFPPLRRYSLRKCTEWLLHHQDATGEWQAYASVQHFALQALVLEGYSAKDDQVIRGLEAMERLTWSDKRGKRLQACHSAVWDTSLMIIALCDSGQPLSSPLLIKAIEWLRSRQHSSSINGVWRIYRPAIGAGGLSFLPRDSWTPDIGSAATALIAFVKQDPKSVSSTWVTRAAEANSIAAEKSQAKEIDSLVETLRRQVKLCNSNIKAVHKYVQANQILPLSQDQDSKSDQSEKQG